jgi:hypothetical protein
MIALAINALDLPGSKTRIRRKTTAMPPASVPWPRVGSRRLCRLRRPGAVRERSRATRRRLRTQNPEPNPPAPRSNVENRDPKRTNTGRDGLFEDAAGASVTERTRDCVYEGGGIPKRSCGRPPLNQDTCLRTPRRAGGRSPNPIDGRSDGRSPNPTEGRAGEVRTQPRVGRAKSEPNRRSGLAKSEPNRGGTRVPVPVRVGFKCPRTVPGAGFVRSLQGLVNERGTGRSR